MKYYIKLCCLESFYVTMWGVFLRLVISILPGLGAAAIYDKVTPDKEDTTPKIGIGFNLKTIILFICLIAGGFVLIFIAKKLNIKLFK